MDEDLLKDEVDQFHEARESRAKAQTEGMELSLLEPAEGSSEDEDDEVRLCYLSELKSSIHKCLILWAIDRYTINRCCTFDVNITMIMSL